MELFPDGGFVRLESRVMTGKFVHADADWKRVSLSRSGAVPYANEVWRVQHLTKPEEEGITYVALQNVAYGRYLSFSVNRAERGGGFRATQMNRSQADGGAGLALETYPWMWRVERLPDPDQDCVSVRYSTCYLRANSNHLFGKKNTRVTVELVKNNASVSTMMHWKIRSLVATPVPQDLPITIEDREIEDGLLFPHPARKIRHVLANDEGEFPQNHHNWESFPFYSSSVVNLKNELRVRQTWDPQGAYTLCVMPGSHGRLMPLVTFALPASSETMNIVVLRAASEAAAQLRYPALPAGAADDVEARV